MTENEQLMIMLEKVIEQNEETNARLLKDNEFLTEIIKEKEKSKRIPWIVCIVISVCSALIICGTFLFFSQYEFYTEETTVTQDTADGGGNNVYFPGENATYNETPKEG